MDGKTILLVEDDAIIAMSEALLLKRYGAKVLTAHTGRQAIEIVATTPEIDLVLMDIDLGDRHMDGTRAAELILQHSDLPVIFLSGHTEPEVVEKTERITSYGYIVKNSGETVVLASIKMAFRLHAAHQALRHTNEQLSLAQESSHAGAWDWDMLNDTFDWSPEVRRIFGMSPDLPANLENWGKFAHPDDRDIVDAYMKACVISKVDPAIDYRIVRPDGETRWIQSTAKTCYDGDRPLRMVGMCMDITAQKQTEQALRESEVNFRTFFETITDMVIVGTPGGEILYTNAAVHKILGYSKQDLAGMHVLDLNPADKRQEAEQIFAAMFRGERDYCPLPVVHKNGTLLPAETRIWLGRWNGQDCIFGLMKDLTAQQEAQQRFERLFRNNPAAMALTSLPERRYVDVNDAFLSSTGYTRAEVLGKTALELDLIAQPEVLQAAAQQLLDSGHIANVEMRLRCKDGSTRDGLFWGDHISSQGHEYFLTVMQDITARKQTERELEAQRDFATQVINVMGQGLTVTDAQGRFEFVNSAYARMFGYEAADLIGKRPQDVTTPEERAELAEQRRLRMAGKTTTYESRLRRADGSVAPVLITGVPRDSAGSYAGAIAVITDLTEQKRVEERILALLKEKELLLREVHHRIKNNMTIISSLLQLQMQKTDDPAAQRALQEAAGQVHSMMVLYDKLYRSENLQAVPARDYIPSLLHEIVELFPHEKDIGIETQLEDILLPANALSALGILLNEMTTNTMKYAFAGRSAGVITVTAACRAGNIVVTFADDGVGLPESARLGQSNGFGMTLMDVLVKQIHGTMTVDGGPGARFKIEFPGE